MGSSYKGYYDRFAFYSSAFESPWVHSRIGVINIGTYRKNGSINWQLITRGSCFRWLIECVHTARHCSYGVSYVEVVVRNQYNTDYIL